MPSISAKLEKQGSQEGLDPLKQVLVMIEHKKRNLEKRKSKLEAYRDDQRNGKELKGEQLAAVAKYDEVCRTLEFAVDMAKHVQGISAEHAKAQKKQQRKEQLERNQSELNRIKEVLVIQDVLMNMGNETVRADFLAGKDGATVVTQDELNLLDELYPLVMPKREDGSAFAQQVSSSADHFMALIEGRNKEVLGSTYATLREVVQRVNTSGYFEQNLQKLTAEFVPGQEMITNETVNDTAVLEASVAEKVEVVAAAAPAPVPPQATPVVAPLPPQAVEQRPGIPVEGVSYFTGPQVAGAAAPQYPPSVPQQQQPIPPPTAMPVPLHAQQQPQQQQQAPQPRPIAEVIGQGNSSFNFLQDSQLDVETPPPSKVDLAVMLQYPPAGGPAAVLPPGRNPAAPAASSVPQPEFHQTIPTQTYTNQNFPVMGPQGAVVPPVSGTSPTPAPTVVPAAHIPAFPQQQQNAAPANFLPPVASQEVPHQVPVPAREEQVKMMTAPQTVSAPTAPTSFAQAAQSFNMKQQNFASGAPPGFGPPQQKIAAQSQFQPIPSLEQVEEQNRAEESNSWANEVDGHDSGEQGHRSGGGGYRGRGGRRGRGGGNYSSGRSRGGQQNGGGRSSGGYQGRGEGSDRSYENGVQHRGERGDYTRGDRGGDYPRGDRGGDYTRGERGGEYTGGGGSNNYKRGPPRDGAPSRGGQGFRGSGGPFRGNRSRGSGGPNQGQRGQQVKQ